MDYVDIILALLPYLGMAGSIIGTFMLTSRVKDHRIKGMEIGLYGAICWTFYAWFSSNFALLGTNLFFICLYIYGMWHNIDPYVAIEERLFTPDDE